MGCRTGTLYNSRLFHSLHESLSSYICVSLIFLNHFPNINYCWVHFFWLTPELSGVAINCRFNISKGIALIRHVLHGPEWHPMSHKIWTIYRPNDRYYLIFRWLNVFSWWEKLVWYQSSTLLFMHQLLTEAFLLEIMFYSCESDINLCLIRKMLNQSW